MRRLPLYLALITAVAASIALLPTAMVRAASKDNNPHPDFHTSDRCVACHNGLKTPSGEDVSIGLQWRASLMANSSRDPYWQASVRRETIDHPESSADVQDECSSCHMPIPHLETRAAGTKTEVLSRLPLSEKHKGIDPSTDGVSCSVCHQVEPAGLGTRQTFNGEVAIAAVAGKDIRPEYGPFPVDTPHQRVMQSSTAGYQPVEGDHMRDAALCGSCHTLYTRARGPSGKDAGVLPEQMPYLEWQHSDYAKRQTCQECHMPRVTEPMRITAVYGPLRNGMHRHVFVGSNFLMEHMLANHRDELDVQALPDELAAASKRTADFLTGTAARISISSLDVNGHAVSFNVHSENLTGHKLPTAYPSRRAWLHVTVRDQGGKIVFESGALRPDGSIIGNDNDENPARFEPHYSQITQPDQVEIFEPILKDSSGHVTTGLLAAVDYAKDNRLLPSGFDKASAGHDIAVVGEANADAGFTDKGAVTHYAIDTGSAAGPFHIEAELWYQPVGYRWAHNLEPYQAVEPQRFVKYYESESHDSAIRLAHAEATR